MALNTVISIITIAVVVETVKHIVVVHCTRIFTLSTCAESVEHNMPEISLVNKSIKCLTVVQEKMYILQFV